MGTSQRPAVGCSDWLGASRGSKLNRNIRVSKHSRRSERRYHRTREPSNLATAPGENEYFASAGCRLERVALLFRELLTRFSSAGGRRPTVKHTCCGILDCRALPSERLR